MAGILFLSIHRLHHNEPQLQTTYFSLSNFKQETNATKHTIADQLDERKIKRKKTLRIHDSENIDHAQFN